MKPTRKLVRNVPALRPLADEELSAVSGAGASLSDLHVTKYVDKASPILGVAERSASSLSKACCSGKHYDSATLVLR
jgi:type VI protein secretion system component Hcp